MRSHIQMEQKETTFVDANFYYKKGSDNYFTITTHKKDTRIINKKVCVCVRANIYFRKLLSSAKNAPPPPPHYKTFGVQVQNRFKTFLISTQGIACPFPRIVPSCVAVRTAGGWKPARGYKQHFVLLTVSRKRQSFRQLNIIALL